MYTGVHMNAYLYQYIIATPILALQIALGILIILIITGRGKKIQQHFSNNGMIYGLVVAIAA
ncbi:MAG: hypothetical protein ACJAV6_000666, partial [Candidatus Paceibacteria bacterium]